MASNSKKRRRVLRVSCILAALIIAGSSFAWFTSKDEVTNRLTASSDYGVSIVESFTPPKNWIPGQEINKDVYAVNTGNIDAFVKEDVSGLLTFTYEDLVTNFDPVNCVELPGEKVTPIDGVTTEEAGGFLAWTNAEVNGERYETGSLASKRKEDLAEGELAWTPPASGDYIFRRAISVDPENSNTVTYSYAGYHYDQGTGKYYKIVIGSDLYPTNTANGQEFDISAPSTQLGVPVDENGVLQGDPTIRYVISNTVSNAKPKFKFVEGTGDENDHLLVSYAATEGAQAILDDLEANKGAALDAYNQAVVAETAAQTNLAQKEVDYRNALGKANSATSRYDQTKLDYEYAKALATATNKLIKAAKETATADAANQKALNDMKTAANNLNDEADTRLGTDGTGTNGKIDDIRANFADAGALNKDTLVPANVRAIINAGGGQTPNPNDLQNAKANLTAFDGYYQDIMNDLGTLDINYAALKNADVANKTSSADFKDSANIQTAYNNIKTAIASLKNHLANYKAAFAAFKTSLVDATAEIGNSDPAVYSYLESYLSGLQAGTAVDMSTVEGLVTAEGTYADGALKTAVDSYKTAYENLKTAEENATTAASDWATAIQTYNTEVDTAKSAYQSNSTGINKVQPLPNNFTLVDGHLTDNSATLVPGNAIQASSNGYSANFDANATNPAIDANTAYTTYATIAQTANPDGTFTVTPIADRTVANENDFEQIVANWANDETPTSPATTDTKQKLSDLKTKKDAADSALATAETAFGAPANGDNPATGAYKTYADAQAAKQAANAAVLAANAAVANSDVATIDIIVNLAEDWDDYWTIDPADKAAVSGVEVVDFYLNKILVAGETSGKLIDSVEMASDMSARDYKDLTFDLNVGLDSVQVTYDANQRGYTTETVDADANFAGMKAQIDDPMTEGSAVEWTATP